MDSTSDDYADATKIFWKLKKKKKQTHAKQTLAKPSICVMGEKKI